MIHQRRMEVHSITDVEAELLNDISDDVYGLWEVDWFFNGRFPEWELDQRIDLLSSIVKRGLIDVFFGRMGTDLTPLPPNAALNAVRNPTNWQPREPLEEPVLHVMTSNAGSNALRAYMTND